MRVLSNGILVVITCVGAWAKLGGMGALAEPPAATLTTLYQFPGGGDGTIPWGDLVSLNGTLYGTTYGGGAYGRGAVYTVNPTTGAEKVLYSFKEGSDVTTPQVGLQVVNGTLYGVASAGGTAGNGGIYTINPSTGAETVLLNFSASMGGGSGSGLVQSGSDLYGVTCCGYINGGFGVVFKFDTTTNTATTLYTFTGGADGGLPQSGVVYVKGMLYGGTTSGGSGGAGTLYAINASTGAETTLYSFDYGTYGGQATGSVVYDSGVLYGATAYGGAGGNGVVYAYTLKSGTISALYSFTGGQDGGTPQGTLDYVKGVLYGTGFSGGAGGFGTVFGINASTGAETTLYTFMGGADGGRSVAPVIDISGTLYGSSEGPGQPGANGGSVFRIKLSSGAEKTLHEFEGQNYENPANSGVISLGNLLYGTTGQGGANQLGSVYSIDPATGAQTTLYSFTGAADGGAPVGGVIATKNTLYGLTEIGGSQGGGVLYAVDPASGAETVIYDFPAGANPRGALLAGKGILYGVTQNGGANGVGAVFGYNVAKNQIATVHSFATSGDGYYPTSGVSASGGYLYGSTFEGGTVGVGTLYQIDVATGAETVLFSFPSGSGGTLAGGTPIYIDGTLYGVTYYGGSAACFSGSGCGVLYAVNATTGVETVLHSFDYTDGAVAYTTLLDVGGVLYGGTEVGGAGFSGTLFSYKLSNSAFTTLYNFTGQADGSDPSGLIYVGTDFYGTSADGATANEGTVFRLVK